MEVVSRTEVLRENAAMVDVQAQQKGIPVAPSGLDMPLFINVDYARMQQVLVNLLSTNAIKYNKAGGAVTVTCTLLHAFVLACAIPGWAWHRPSVRIFSNHSIGLAKRLAKKKGKRHRPGRRIATCCRDDRHHRRAG